MAQEELKEKRLKDINSIKTAKGKKSFKKSKIKSSLYKKEQLVY